MEKRDRLVRQKHKDRPPKIRSIQLLRGICKLKKIEWSVDEIALLFNMETKTNKQGNQTKSYRERESAMVQINHLYYVRTFAERTPGPLPLHHYQY